jgi:hypothetical protein
LWARPLQDDAPHKAGADPERLTDLQDACADLVEAQDADLDV